MDVAVTALRGLTATIVVALATLCSAQDHAFRLIQESYMDGGSGMRGLQSGGDWTELRVASGSRWSGVFSGFHYGSDGMLDEDYIEFSGRAFSMRAGRMESAFGFGTWSDL